MAERRLPVEARDIDGEKIIPDTAQQRVYSNVSDLTRGEKGQCRDLVGYVKELHSPGLPITNDDVKQFCDLVVAKSWTSQRASMAPDYRVIAPKLHSTAVHVGTVTRDIPPASMTKKASGNRAVKNRVHKRSEEMIQPSPERRHGSEILMRAVPNAQAGMSFHFIDKRARLIPVPY